MRTLIVLVVAAILGTAGGLLTNWIENIRITNLFPRSPEEVIEDLAAPTPIPDGEKIARIAVIGGPLYHFGTMEQHGTRSHTFVIKNVGNMPLYLEKGETTCKCTMSELEDGKVMPGETTNVVLTWKATEGGPDLQFSQTAKIRSNDPDHGILELRVHGTIKQSIRSVPPNISLSRISTSETNSVKVNVLSLNHKDVAVTKATFENPKADDYFEFHFRTLTSEELSEKFADAASGVEVTVVVKPGLPLGIINEKLLLTTNLPDEPVLEIPTGGSVVSDISVLGGRGFDINRNVLRLGTIDRGEGKKRTLYVLIRGPHREETELSIHSTDPADVLKAKLGEREVVNDAVVKYPLMIEIPPGSRQVSRLSNGGKDSARIVIDTTHPNAKKLIVLVRFAVE